MTKTTKAVSGVMLAVAVGTGVMLVTSPKWKPAPWGSKSSGMVATPWQKVTIKWNYVNDPAIVFNVFRSVNLITWQYIGSSKSNSISITMDKPFAYFTVNASNIITHQVSEFATK